MTISARGWRRVATLVVSGAGIVGLTGCHDGYSSSYAFGIGRSYHADYYAPAYHRPVHVHHGLRIGHGWHGHGHGHRGHGHHGHHRHCHRY